MKTIFICLFTMASVVLYAQTPVLSDSIQTSLKFDCALSGKPLYVLNNKILPCDSVRFINPADIIEIEVLRGASASTLYGPVAGLNGTVIITTKQYAMLQKSNKKNSL